MLETVEKAKEVSSDQMKSHDGMILQGSVQKNHVNIETLKGIKSWHKFQLVSRGNAIAFLTSSETETIKQEKQLSAISFPTYII